MSERTKRIIILVAIGQLLLAAFALTLPSIVEALPGSVRVRLPAAISDLAVTPIPDIPAPNRPVAERPVTVPLLALEPTPLPPATLEPALTEVDAVATEAAVVEPTAVNPTVVPPTETPTPTPTNTPTPQPPPPQYMIEGLKPIGQTFNNCGPANMSIVLNFHGDTTTQAEAASYLKPNPEDRNVSPWQISDYINERTGLRSTTHSGGTLELVKRLVAAGLPVVVEKGYLPRTAEGWYGHYLTVFGYDDDARLFHSMDTFNDGNPGPVTTPYDEMNQYWQQFNYTFYVVYSPEQEQQVHRIIGPELLDPMTMWQNAAMRAQKEVEAEPDNAYTWFNLGTSLTRLGERTGELSYYEAGAEAFDQARTIGLPGRMLWYQFRPYLAYMRTGRYDDMLDLAAAVLSTDGGRNVEETYLYQGHALAFTGDIRGARAAYQRALELNRYFYPAQIALDSLPG